MKDPVQQLYDWLNERGLAEARAHSAPPRRFRASESAGCTRKIWFRLRGDRPAPRGARGQLYGIGGDAHHDVLRQLFEHTDAKIGGVTYNEDGSVDENMFVRREFRVPLQKTGQMVTVEVTGRADGEINTPKGPALCEIKSTGFWPYKWLNDTYWEKGEEAAFERIKEKHKGWYWQCQVTMALTGHKLCYLIVKDRSGEGVGLVNEDATKAAGIYIPFDRDVFDEILGRFAYISHKLSHGEKPAAEFAAKSNECKYCEWYHLCHGAAERRTKGLEPVVLYPGPRMEEYHAQGEDSGIVRKGRKRKDDSGEVAGE